VRIQEMFSFGQFSSNLQQPWLHFIDAQFNVAETLKHLSLRIDLCMTNLEHGNNNRRVGLSSNGDG
jgi:hypothetical protein